MVYEEKNSVYVPSYGPVIASYSIEEYAAFVIDVCKESGFTSLQEAITHLSFDDYHIRKYIETVIQGITYYEGIYLQTITNGQKEAHKKIRELLYEVPFNKLPLYINEDPDYIAIVKWRLKLGK